MPISLDSIKELNNAIISSLAEAHEILPIPWKEKDTSKCQQSGVEKN